MIQRIIFWNNIALTHDSHNFKKKCDVVHVIDLFTNYYQKHTKPPVTSITTMKRTMENATIQGITYSLCRLSTRIIVYNQCNCIIDNICPRKMFKVK